ncbi:MULTISPECIES: acyl carrier protein [Kitasatospora]|uniref:Methoxymalonate biosynthesis protein n=1 Tax=Kitasatospora setae (strain ATCC 33774 / DSM 43861 / JCM 3304 / KCC A-0304 / NBRC 14216 / KM-6054) TaxID=452652 RepID=E4NJF7_KITSK|nr:MULTISPECIES: acyl carrier protein [Kitasatospora]BAJ33105.1 methoxymalonate biosynthesis protein [Kitasatospora setae KM-6054]
MSTANTPDTHELEKELLGFLEARTGTAWDADTDLFDAGGLSSLFAMQVVVHLEKTYAVAVRGADLRLDNFRTVRRMAELVARLRESAAGGPRG